MCQGNQFIIIAQLIDHNRSVNIVIIDNNTPRVNTLTVKILINSQPRRGDTHCDGKGC